MYRTILWLSVVVLILCACRSELSPVETSTVMEDENQLELVGPVDLGGKYCELYLIDHVGITYYQEHYHLLQEERMGEYLLKAYFTYTYEPYVQDYPFVLWLDYKTWELFSGQNSEVLLEPQEFLISPDQAEIIALQNGLSPGQVYEHHLVFDSTTNFRFAWLVTYPAMAGNKQKTQDYVLDVESGKIYLTTGLAPNP